MNGNAGTGEDAADAEEMSASYGWWGRAWTRSGAAAPAPRRDGGRNTARCAHEAQLFVPKTERFLCEQTFVEICGATNTAQPRRLAPAQCSLKGGRAQTANRHAFDSKKLLLHTEYVCAVKYKILCCNMPSDKNFLRKRAHVRPRLKEHCAAGSAAPLCFVGGPSGPARKRLGIGRRPFWPRTRRSCAVAHGVPVAASMGSPRILCCHPHRCATKLPIDETSPQTHRAASAGVWRRVCRLGAATESPCGGGRAKPLVAETPIVTSLMAYRFRSHPRTLLHGRGRL